MADVEHKNLTGTDLHEMKGASTALVNQVPVANGTGGTVFKKLDANTIDETSIKNLNTEKVLVDVLNPNVNFDYYIPVEVNKTLQKVDVVISGTVAGADLTIDVMKNATVLSSFVFPVIGTSAGSKLTLSPNATFLTTDNLRIRSTSVGVSAAGSVRLLLTYRI
jgi:hypothetical protein